MESLKITSTTPVTTTESTNTVDWAIVSSVCPNELDIDKINDFALWYAQSINEVSVQHRRDIMLSPKPAVILRVPSGEKETCQEAYHTIHTDTPNIAIVIHLLPTHNSKEFVWMKELTELYGLVRQGIQSANVTSRFIDSKPSQETALNNMSSWLSHRVHKLAVGGMKAEGVHVSIRVENEYCVREGDDEGADRPQSHCSSDEGKENVSRVTSVVDDKKTDSTPLDYGLEYTSMAQAVWMSLHGYQNPVRPLFAKHDYAEYGKCRGDAWLEIGELPSTASEWDVAGFLGEYNVRSVYFTTKHGSTGKKIARVCLGSRWEALHCMERAATFKYHERYPVSITACHDRTLDMAETCVRYDGKTKAYKQYSNKKAFNEACKA